MTTLDRVIVSTEWSALFPLTYIKTLPKPISDHTPNLVDAGVNHAPPPRLFRFEKWWLGHEDFINLVVSTWNTPRSFSNAVDV